MAPGDARTRRPDRGRRSTSSPRHHSSFSLGIRRRDGFKARRVPNLPAAPRGSPRAAARSRSPGFRADRRARRDCRVPRAPRARRRVPPSMPGAAVGARLVRARRDRSISVCSTVRGTLCPRLTPSGAESRDASGSPPSIAVASHSAVRLGLLCCAFKVRGERRDRGVRIENQRSKKRLPPSTARGQRAPQWPPCAWPPPRCDRARPPSGDRRPRRRARRAGTLVRHARPRQPRRRFGSSSARSTASSDRAIADCFEDAQCGHAARWPVRLDVPTSAMSRSRARAPMTVRRVMAVSRVTARSDQVGDEGSICRRTTPRCHGCSTRRMRSRGDPRGGKALKVGHASGHRSSVAVIDV